MRVAQLDMTFQGSKCPAGLKQGLYGGKTLCGSQPIAGCSSTFFNNFGVPYSEVCGFVVAYQDGSPDAFQIKSEDIDSAYLDGISITYGSRPRKHIWSLAAGVASGRSLEYDCPCNVGAPDTVPYFVGHDYYCESGNPTRDTRQQFFPDVLWDGKSCTLNEVPCCKDPWLPYFRKELGGLSTDPIELRICHHQPGSDEDVPIESYEFFVR